MSKVRDPYDIWQRNQRKKAQFAELYGKKPQDQAKPVHFPTKFVNYGKIGEKPVKSDDSDSKYSQRDEIMRIADWNRPTDSTPDPNRAFKAKKREKMSSYDYIAAVERITGQLTKK